jgi:hypothetical protein
MADVLLRAAEERRVLGYAQDQQRWEKGVRWLLWIVCGAAWVQGLSAGVIGWKDVENRIMWRSFAAPVEVVVCEVATAVGWLWVGCVTFWGLLRFGRVRGWVVWSLSIQMAVLASRALALALDRSFYFSPYLRSVAIPGEAVGSHTTGFIQTLMPGLYPLVLLAFLYPSRDGGRRPSGRALWWLTAGTCVAAALPLTQVWVTQFESTYHRTIVNLWIISRNSPWSQMVALGTLAGTFAGFFACGAVLWMAFGRKGRAALKICAALLVVYAIGAEGGAVGRWAMHISGTGILSRPLSAPFDIAEAITSVALWVAFAAAVRVALDLADVRARLEGGRSEEMPVSGPESGRV